MAADMSWLRGFGLTEVFILLVPRSGVDLFAYKVRIFLFGVLYPIFNTVRTNGSRTIIYPFRGWGIIIFFEFHFKVCGDIVRYGI